MRALLPSPAPLDALHSTLRERGLDLLQPFRFGDTDEEHVSVLLSVAEIPANASVLDIGCGVGACARLMHEERPDLSFTLLNYSAKQLADCPDQFTKILADAHSLPIPNEVFDVVMFNTALGNMDIQVALAEATRVLKPGGVLLLNELEREAGMPALLEQVLSFRPVEPYDLAVFCPGIGLLQSEVLALEVKREYLREMWDETVPYEDVFAGVKPAVWRFTKVGKTTPAALAGQFFHRHEKIALQVSGGKDSLATLFLMLPWWERLDVCWLNTGDPVPETVAYMAFLQDMLPSFREITGKQPEIVAADGWPSDVVPTIYTTMGQAIFGPQPFKVQDRLSCCFRSLMAPLHSAMVAGGYTLLIRGKRREEKDKTETRTGSTIAGVEFLYPVWDWTEAEVLQYLEDNEIPLPGYYEQTNHSLDCMSCTAWWGEGLPKYLEAKHPEQHTEYVRRIHLIKQAISEQMADCEA